MIEKRVFFDSNNNPSEIRYYEEDILVARLGIIQDTDGNFIGLRELNPLDVMPLGWVDRFKQLFGNKPKRLDVTTIDFIGLINWINTIKTIKTIETINTINNIVKVRVNASSSSTIGNAISVPVGIETDIINKSGMGITNGLEVLVSAGATSEQTLIKVYCDGVVTFGLSFGQMNAKGYTVTTHLLSLLLYAVNGQCVMFISKPFYFLSSFRVTAFNGGNSQTVTSTAYLDLIV